MWRDVAEEAFRNREAPEVLEAVQQPVGVGRIAPRLELPEPHEPRHAGVDRLFEQLLEVAPQPGRHPLGDAGLDAAFRVDERVGAEPLDRRRGRQDGPRAPAGLDEPPDQVLVRLRLRCFFAEPRDERTRRAAREGPKSVQAAQLRQMLVPGLGTAPRSRRAQESSAVSLSGIGADAYGSDVLVLLVLVALLDVGALLLQQLPQHRPMAPVLARAIAAH